MQRKTCWLHFFAHFSSTDQGGIWCGVKAVQFERLNIKQTIFDQFECHMYLCYELCLSCQLTGYLGSCLSFLAKTLSFNITCKLSTKFCHTCHACRHHCLFHFIPLSLTVTLHGGYKVSTKQNLLASFSHTLFIRSGWNLMWLWNNLTWISRDYWNKKTRDYWNKKNDSCFTDSIGWASFEHLLFLFSKI